MNKVTIRQYHDEIKTKNNALTDYLTRASLFVKKDLMEIILQKAFLTVQTEFYCLYYKVKIFLVKYSINACLHFTNNKLHKRIS